VRATLYVNFPTREALLEAVTERAFAEVTPDIRAAEPQEGDPAEALARVIAAAWQTLGRYHPLIAFNTRRHTDEELHRRHGDVLGERRPLIERGQADGAFRADVTTAWHLAMFMGLVHAASAEMRAGRLPEDDAQDAVVATVLGAVTDHRPPPGRSSPCHQEGR
jgi:TetR/AcrR family transcriptional regulator, mexCD-oprJ operon repressor